MDAAAETAARCNGGSLSKSKKASHLSMRGLFVCLNPGNDLVSHKVALAVPSAQRGLTSVFGMGTGVTLSIQSPETFYDVGFRMADVETTVWFPHPPFEIRHQELRGP